MTLLSTLVGTSFSGVRVATQSITSNTAIDSSYNQKLLVCNSTSDIYLDLPDSTTLDDGFNFRVYSINSGQVILTCNSGSDYIKTGSEDRSSVTMFRNTEIIKSANTAYLMLE